MRIIKARIKNFRSIDNIKFDVNRKITSYVGANESGKSNVLSALSKINLNGIFHEDDLSRLYKTNTTLSLPEISIKCELNEEEIKSIENLKLSSIYEIANIQITKNINSNKINENRELVDVSYSVLINGKSIVEYSSLNEKRENEILSIIPNIYYYNDTNIKNFLLPKSVKIDELKNKPTKYQTVINLLKLGNIHIDNIIDGTHNAESYINEATELINEIFPIYWKQDPSIKFRLNIDHTKTLNIHITDQISKRESPISRSDGVQWFMAFLIKFLGETRGNENMGSIMLFDELGLHLHPSGQRDLLKLIDDFSETNQIIYTTHFPYLLNQNFPERIFVVSKGNNSKGKNRIGTNIDGKPYKEIWGNVRSSIGLLLGDNFFCSANTLIVEGASENFAIRGINNFLRKSDKPNFDSDDITIFQAEGTDSGIRNATMFCKNLELNVSVLVDGDSDGDKAKVKIENHNMLNEVPVISLRSYFKGEKEVTIEDLIPRNIYFAAMNIRYTDVFPDWKTVTPNDVNITNDLKFINQIIAYMEDEKALGKGNYDKVGVMREVSILLDTFDSEKLYNAYKTDFDRIETFINDIINSFKEVKIE